ncbi:N-acetylmuramoyl-L-alanine amidase [Lichenihabitans psoromatis]|uniref:N-acetylmuramoyl-L-alanine amidase n=1 Tax=Lichenihabitans psoromatis TaxID=2528642 RepID=UPI00103843ED|nr:N-acetylmuramoyl-L-alanine amidase [Lichenihabitans psoromatis]
MLAVLGLLLMPGPGWTAPDLSEHAPPMAVGYKLERIGATTRLSLDLSSSVTANATVLEAPDRVIIDLPEVNFQIDPLAGHLKPDRDPLIRSFRFGLFAPGRSRIVIDLAGPATVAKLATTSIAGGDPSRMVIELTKVDRGTFHKAVLVDAPPAPPASTATISDQAPDATALPLVVIDPGHGGVDPGASGLDGVVEKNIVFDFSTMLADKLKATGRYRVRLTRTDDSFVSLGDRVRIARDSNAALFVSVHADTLTVNGSVTGATVYTSSDKASDAEAARVADAENQSDQAAGVQAEPEKPDVNDILFDLTRRETRTYSHLFQRTLVGYWQKIARLNKNPERSAGFMVLKAPDVPSVLLELGYLSSDKDVKNLTSTEWRDGATGSIVNAIDSFFAPRHPTTNGTATIPAAPTGATRTAGHADEARATN